MFSNSFRVKKIFKRLNLIYIVRIHIIGVDKNVLSIYKMLYQFSINSKYQNNGIKASWWRDMPKNLQSMLR